MDNEKDVSKPSECRLLDSLECWRLVFFGGWEMSFSGPLNICFSSFLVLGFSRLLVLAHCHDTNPLPISSFLEALFRGMVWKSTRITCVNPVCFNGA